MTANLSMLFTPLIAVGFLISIIVVYIFVRTDVNGKKEYEHKEPEPSLILTVSYPNVVSIDDDVKLEIKTNLPSRVDIIDALDAFKVDKSVVSVDGYKTINIKPLKPGKHSFRVKASYNGKKAEKIVKIEVKKLCKTCGAEIDELLNVCPKCGEVIRRICPNCGTSMDPAWRVCPRCGYGESGSSTKIYAEEIICPICGTPLEVEWGSCPKCGERFSCVCLNPDPNWVYCPICRRRLK